MSEPLPKLTSCPKEDLILVYLWSYGLDAEGHKVELDPVGAHFHQVWVTYANVTSQTEEAEEFTQDFYDYQLAQARAYAWQLAAKYQLEVHEYD